MQPTPQYVEVTCPVCKARLNPRAEWVGRKVRCPDCHSAVLVNPPAPRVPVPAPRPAGEYSLSQGSADAVAESQIYLVICPQCHARLHPRREHAGRRIKCPDCDTRFIAPSAAIQEPVAPPIPTPGQYAVAEASAPPSPTFEYLTVQTSLEADPLPPPPSIWFLTGVLDFPFRLDVLGHFVIIALLSTLAGLYSALIYWLYLKYGSMGMQVAATFVVGAFWLWLWTLSYAAASVVAIVQETAAGSNEITTVDNDWRERIWPMFFLGYLVMLTALPGYAAGMLLNSILGPAGMIAGLLGFAVVVLPVLLLSSLEAANWVVPFSPLILQSLARFWWAWFIVYAELFALILIPLALIALSFQWTLFITVIWAAPVASAVVLIAARLVGRLAWRIGRA